jgi:hypothetical protein
MENKTIALYCRYASVPISVPQKEYIEYYLDLLDPYYKCKYSFELFKTELKRHNSEEKYRSHINDVMSEIVAKISESDEMKKFKKEYPSMCKKTKLVGKPKSIFSPQNNSKEFLSIDIRSANFNMVYKCCPEALQGFNTWTELISSYTDDKFIIQSKFFREVVFGKIGVSKATSKLYPVYLETVLDALEKKGVYTIDDVACVCSDEIIFNYNGYIPDFLDNDLYKCVVFKLKKIKDRKFYITNISYPEKKINFKCIPKKFICQVIRKFNNEAVTENDLQFIDEGLIASYKKSIFE